MKLSFLNWNLDFLEEWGKKADLIEKRLNFIAKNHHSRISSKDEFVKNICKQPINLAEHKFINKSSFVCKISEAIKTPNYVIELFHIPEYRDLVNSYKNYKYRYFLLLIASIFTIVLLFNNFISAN